MSAKNTVTGVTFVPRSVGIRLKFRLRLMEQLITMSQLMCLIIVDKSLAQHHIQ